MVDWERWKESIKNPSMHDAVMIGVMTNIFLVFIVLLLLFFFANTVSVGAKPHPPPDEHHVYNDTMFIGHPGAQDAGFDIHVDDLPHVASRRVYPVHVQDPNQASANMSVSVNYDTEILTTNPCTQSSNLDLYIYNSTGHFVDGKEIACDNGITSTTVHFAEGDYTVEVIGKHGATVNYELEIRIRYFDT